VRLLARAEATVSSASTGPRCADIPLRDWAQGLRLIAELEDASLLWKSDAAVLKARIRRLDVGCLLVLQAYREYGHERLAVELRAMLTEDAMILEESQSGT